VAEHFIFSFMSITRSRLRPRAESGLRAGQYDRPTIGIRPKAGGLQPNGHPVVKYHDTDVGFLCLLPLPSS
jgi:hypothetical protein